MLASYNWLKEYVNIKQDAYQLAQELTLIGLEVSQVKHLFKAPKHVVVGEIIAISPHPNASRLNLTKVNIGNETLDIVCGADNIKIGDKVPVALLGAVLSNGLEIKASNIRGEMSKGMLCSEAELELKNISDGVWILPVETKAGRPIADFFPEEDFILDFSITSNRPDCLNIVGLAREIASLNGSYLVDNLLSKKKIIKLPKKSKSIEIEVRDFKKCNRYSARVIGGITVAPSPNWLSTRLLSLGLRPINNIVDITNYILLKFGQPMHAFSFEKIKGEKIIVRNAGDGEHFVALDGHELVLSAKDLVIADKNGAIALAGVIGGKNSGVHKNTDSILLECAHFDPSAIRETSKRHRIQTDSSFRFGRHVNIKTTALIADYATDLILKIAGGEVFSGLKDVYPNKQKPKEINFRYDAAKKKLGVVIQKVEINKIFQNLGFSLQQITSETIKVAVPEARNDLEYEWDLVEEIARVYGYDNIPESLPAIANSTPSIYQNSNTELIKKVSGLGYNQMINLSFVENKFLEDNGLIKEETTGLNAPIKVKNPVTVDIAYLRQNLLFGLLSNVKLNLEQHIDENQKLFEIGHVFEKKDDKCSEKNNLGMLGYGASESPNWAIKKDEYTYYHLSEDIRKLLEPLQKNNIIFKEISSPLFSPLASASIHHKGQQVGMIGLVNPKLLEWLGIKKQKIFYAEITVSATLKDKKEIKFTPFSPYPSVYRDFAIIASVSLDTRSIMDTIKSFDEHIQKVNLMDIYRGEEVKDGKISVVFNIEYQSFEKTLSKESVDIIEKKLAEHIVKTFSVELR